MEIPQLLSLDVDSSKKQYAPIPGKVVFIHPERRFYTFEKAGHSRLSLHPSGLTSDCEEFSPKRRRKRAEPS